ncbi:MFS transporter [Streptomyces sp. NPDC020298]|uniref:MFS transporter n=1 Tax=unclassified Streptomyces TaxID=2593676 RepID=UPI0033CAC99B
MDTAIVNVAFETISHSFGTTASKLAWVLNAYSLAFAAILIPAGRLADRYGRKKLFLIGLGGFALMSALCGLAPAPGVLIAGRALQALFAALVVPTSLALLLPEFPGARRHAAVGTWGAMGAAAAACGPTLGALLLQYASWRWIFLVNAPICAVMIVFGARILRESRDQHAEGLPDPVAVVLVAAVPAALSYAIIQGPTRGWSSRVVIAAFVAAAVLTPLLLWRSATAARPVIDLSLFSDRQFSLMNLAILLFSMSFYGTLLSNVIFLQQVWGYSVLRAALAGAPGPLLVALIARSASRLAARIGFRPVLLLGGVTWMAGAALLAAGVDASPHWAAHWLPPVLLTGAGIGLTLPVQAGAAVASLPDHRSVRDRFRGEPELPATGRRARHQPVRRRRRESRAGAGRPYLLAHMVGVRRNRPGQRADRLAPRADSQCRRREAGRGRRQVGRRLMLSRPEPHRPSAQGRSSAGAPEGALRGEGESGRVAGLCRARPPARILSLPRSRSSRCMHTWCPLLTKGRCPTPGRPCWSPARHLRSWQGAKDVVQRPSVRRTQLVRASRDATAMAVSAATSS